MTETNIVPVSIEQAYANLDFRPWAEAVQQYPDSMLPVTSEALRESFEKDMAVALVDRETRKVMGGSRLIPLLDNGLREKIGLDRDFPQIWEMGSVIIVDDPKARGNGFSFKLNKALLDSVRQRTDSGELLIIGTTKTLFLIRTLLKENIGLNFSISSHDEYPMIAPLTCVCKGEMGQGFQESNNCSARIKPEQAANLLNSACKDGKIPCTLFVSDRELAQKIEEGLKTRFSKDNLLDPQKAETDLLRNMGYYR